MIIVGLQASDALQLPRVVITGQASSSAPKRQLTSSCMPDTTAWDLLPEARVIHMSFPDQRELYNLICDLDRRECPWTDCLFNAPIQMLTLRPDERPTFIKCLVAGSFTGRRSGRQFSCSFTHVGLVAVADFGTYVVGRRYRS